MNQLDILRLLCKSYPIIDKEINIAQELLKGNKELKAAEKYRDVARKMLENNLTSFAVQYYSMARDLFLENESYLKALNTEITVYNIHVVNNDVLEQANSHEKIASYYKYYFKDFFKAGEFYLSSSKHHEANQNYRSAYKKASFAAECFEQTKNRQKIFNAHSLAFRMALQSDYQEKACEHILKSHNYIKKIYNAHYISVCVKGFITFQKTDRYNETLFFANEIIHTHYVLNIPQGKILKYLIEAQKLSLLVSQSVNQDYNKKIIAVFQDDYSKKINYSLELSLFAKTNELTDVSDFFYLQMQNYRKANFKNQKQYSKFLTSLLWQVTCNYGTNVLRWLIASISIIFLFGILFSNIPCPDFFPSSIKDILISMHPEFKISSIKNIFTPFYYSTVTFTTLGFGDIIPMNLCAQLYCVIEVIIGYIMLGGLLTVFSKKIVR